MKPGERFICQEPDWWNAYGESYLKLTIGDRVTLRDTKRVAGMIFFSFEEHPEDHWFWSTGFKSMRSLN
jgi:hypothetical protein